MPVVANRKAIAIVSSIFFIGIRLFNQLIDLNLKLGAKKLKKITPMKKNYSFTTRRTAIPFSETIRTR